MNMSTTQDQAMKLTAKQEQFAQAVARGKYNSLSEAWKACYNSENMSPASVNVAASRLASNAKIMLRVDQLRQDIDKAIVSAAVSDRDRVLSKLRELLDTDDGGSHVNHQLTAARLLGQSVGLYKDVTVQEDDVRSSADVRAEIAERLALLQADGTKH